MRIACLLVQPIYKPGDPAPDGYLAWHEWAETQHKAGLRQKECAKCGLWKYPQELSDTLMEFVGETSGGVKVRSSSRLCLSCESKIRESHEAD